jgi:hypothetical protein
MVLNNSIFPDFMPVFDQKLEMGCSQNKMKSAPVGTISDDS